jgi:copper chaperone
MELKMKTKEFKIEGMSCQHCVMAVEKELAKLALDENKVEIGSAKIVYDENKVEENQIIEAINESGYKVV